MIKEEYSKESEIKISECLNCKFNFYTTRLESHEIRCTKLLSNINNLQKSYNEIKINKVDKNKKLLYEMPKIINLDEKSEEYINVSEILFKSGDENINLFNIISIDKIVHPRAIERYEMKKERINKKLKQNKSKIPVKEGWLFHYIHDYIDNSKPVDICLDELSFQVSQSKESFLGQGLYFYHDFIDAIGYYDELPEVNHELNSVILAKVLTGNSLEINHEETLGTYKIKNYNDIVNFNKKERNEGYVIHCDYNAVPLYIINYSDGSFTYKYYRNHYKKNINK